jgi:hypothetical protein
MERPLRAVHLIRVLRLPGSRLKFIEQDLDPVLISILQCLHSASVTPRTSALSH